MAFRTHIDDTKLEALIKASDNGEEWAQREYGRIFDEYDMDPYFIERVCQARVNIYRAPAQYGDKNAILRYAHALAYLGYKKEAYDWYFVLINKGDTDAMLALSEQYNEYGSLGHNPDEEMRWLKLAGHGGNAEAQNMLGRECLCERDDYHALLWYEMSAKQNNPEGRIGYAGCLHEQLKVFKEYLKGWDEVIPGRYDYIKKKYGKLSSQQCRAVMNDLYWKIETLYLDGLKRCNSDSYLSDAFSGLSGLYLYPQGVCNPMPYLAAFYYFEKFRVLENQFAYDKCVEIIKENNLKVTKSDLQEWARIGVFEWAKKRQIDLRGGNVRKVGSSTLAEKNKSDYNHTTTSCDTVSSKGVVDYIVNQFKRENNIDLSDDSISIQRIQAVVDKNLRQIKSGETVLISLPFISANAKGPLHLEMKVSLDKIS